MKIQKELEVEESKPPSPPHIEPMSEGDLDDLLARQLQREEDERQSEAILRRQPYKTKYTTEDEVNLTRMDITRPTVSSSARSVVPIPRRAHVHHARVGESYEELLRLDDTIKKRGLSSQKFDSFPIINWTSTKEASNCVICLEDYKAGDKVVIMPCCVTKFHAVCAQKALAETRSCPFCRKELED